MKKNWGPDLENTELVVFVRQSIIPYRGKMSTSFVRM